MNIHEAARKILEMPELPELRSGLCAAIPLAVGPDYDYDYVHWSRLFDQCNAFMTPGVRYLPDFGVWTEQRLNAVCLLAASKAEDFEQVGLTEAEMLVAAGFTTEEATAAVKARIASPWCAGPWDGAVPVCGWLEDAFLFSENGGLAFWKAVYDRLYVSLS